MKIVKTTDRLEVTTDKAGFFLYISKYAFDLSVGNFNLQIVH